jgi:IS4 transposase
VDLIAELTEHRRFGGKGGASSTPVKAGVILPITREKGDQKAPDYSNPTGRKTVAQGVTLDAMVRLGHRGGGGLQRVVVLKRPGMAEPVVLVTSEAPDSLSALEVLALYRHRWEVEIFFRWLTCLVPCRHWFAESREGVRIQIYLCLIKALLLAPLGLGPLTGIRRSYSRRRNTRRAY